MRSLRRRALAMGACAAMMLAALVTAASSASASSSWQLVDEFTTSHPACYTTGGGTNDLAIDLNGSWSAPINIGASGLPAGVSVASTPVIRLLLLDSWRRYAELRHCADPGWLEQRDRAGQSGSATRPAKTTHWMRKATWRWRYRLAFRRIRRSTSRCGLAMAPPSRPKPCPS